MKTLAWDEVSDLVRDLHERISDEPTVEIGPLRFDSFPCIELYGIPRGGSVVAAMLASSFPGYRLVNDIRLAGVIVDDLVDSGRTAERAKLEIEGGDYGCDAYFDALIRKPHSPVDHAPGAEVFDEWIVFPWEMSMGEDGDKSAEDAVVRIIERVGEDPTREGLVETPKRVIKAFVEMTAGYQEDPDSYVKIFHENQADEMVCLQGISFTSLCEHHLLPFWGTGSVGYIPSDGRVIGLSKLARIVHTFAKRFQNQERLTQQVARYLHEHEKLSPLGVGVVLKAHHTCMSCRGIRQQGSQMITSATFGTIRSEDSARSEFLSLALPGL